VVLISYLIRVIVWAFIIFNFSLGFLFGLFLLTTPNKTSSSGTSKTYLLTRRSKLTNSRWMTNMLVITTTMWMVDGVHCHTSYNRPHLPLRAELMELNTSLEDWFISTTTSCNDTNCSTTITFNSFTGT